MEAQHFRTIVNKIKSKNIDEIQFGISNKKLNLVTTSFKNFRVSIDKSNSDRFTVHIRKDTERHEQRFYFEPFMIKLLSPSWHTWRSLAKILEKKKQGEDEEQRQRIRDMENRNLNELLVEVFPEIIEDELLGE